MTGKRVASGAFIPPQKKREVDEVIKEFVDETDSFIKSYFGGGEAIQERVVGFNHLMICFEDR